MKASFSQSRILAVLLSVALAGCASAKVTPETVAATPVKPARPDRVVVYDFAVNSGEVSPNQGLLEKAYRDMAENAEQQQAKQLQMAHDVARDLSDALVEKLAALGFAAGEIPRGTPPPDGALVFDGSFVNISQGNQLRRLVIGFGAGASTIDTQVNIYMMQGGNPQSLRSFTTHADSGKMPGAAVTMGAGAAAQGGATVAAGAATAGLAGVKTYRSSMGSLADMTAKQIAAYFSQYAADQGWISRDQVMQASVSTPK
ncbi:MAG TPA: DUF4410 domain-containing protein [Candidatus Binataceae bacterium]|nr:DUF4410 domain-containing protein [Candidatus Binataceae bacterium]